MVMQSHYLLNPWVTGRCTVQRNNIPVHFGKIYVLIHRDFRMEIYDQ